MGRKHAAGNDGGAVGAADNGSSATAEASIVGVDRNGKPRKSKRERFLALVEKRMTTAIRRLKMCERLGNRNQYEYTDAEAVKIVDSLSTAVVAVQIAFTEKAKRADMWKL